MKILNRLPCACALLLALAVPIAAVETQVKSYRTVADFAPGEMDHVSVSPQGRLVLSPGYRRLADLDEPVAWSVAIAGNDVLAATGHDGKVLRMPGGGAGAAPGGPAAEGRPSVVLDAAELEVHAIAVAADGTVLAATSPDGKVYAIPPKGEPSVVFDPEERYIWALLPAPDGSLYVATGDKGAVYRVAKDGATTPVLSAEETHILSLALSPEGVLYAGSGGNGYVYRRDPDGKTTVLLDTAGSEVKALALDAQGNLFAASTGRPIGGEILPTPVAPAGTVTARVAEEAPGGLAETPDAAVQPWLGPMQQPPAPPPIQAVPFPNVIPGAYPAQGPRQSWLYRIRKDGLPEELWRSDNETVHAMALLRGEVLLGTGDEGKVLAVDPVAGRASILLDFPGAQVTALAVHGEGFAAVTSNLASIWMVESRPAPEGSYTSPVLDAGHFATWGRLTVTAEGGVRAETRSGNTEKPGARWSAWENAAGEVKSPKGRYLQYRLRLSAPAGGVRPEVKQVELAYLPYNLAPRLRSITVLEPHVELVSTAAGPAGLGATGRTLPPARGRKEGGGSGAEVRPAPREQETAGSRSVRWEVDDPNDDELSFRVYCRGEGENEWKALGDETPESFLAFDSTALPDGTYQFKVQASDGPSNPASRALRSDILSEPFLIDNTPPRVEVSPVAGDAKRLAVKATISDRTSVIQWAEYSLDGGEWRPADPEDQVFDEHEETVSVTLANPGAGEHTVVVRAEDAARNVGSGKSVIKSGAAAEHRSKQDQDQP